VTVLTWLALGGAVAVALVAAAEVRRYAAVRAAGRRFLRHPTATAGVFILVFFITTALAASLVAPYAPAEQIDPVHLQNQPPSIRFPLGTDVYSRDVWSRLVYGARLSLGIGTIAMLVAVTVGAGVGAAAGYWRGGIDAVLMRSVDVGLAMPRMFVLHMAVALCWCCSSGSRGGSAPAGWYEPRCSACGSASSSPRRGPWARDRRA